MRKKQRLRIIAIAVVVSMFMAISATPAWAIEISQEKTVTVSAAVDFPENPIVAYCMNPDGSYNGRSVPIDISFYDEIIGHPDYYCAGWWATAVDGTLYLDKSYIPLFWTESADGTLTPIFALEY
jgi:hypothetical protein